MRPAKLKHIGLQLYTVRGEMARDFEGTLARVAAIGGRGVIDFRKIFARRAQAGIRHFFVEHDQPADAFASIRASYEYLKRLEF